MRWTEDELNDYLSRHNQVLPLSKMSKVGHLRLGRTPNKTEIRFERDILAYGEKSFYLLWWVYEGITLLLAPGLRYTPDWVAFDLMDRVYCFEVKGPQPLRDDSIAKFKMARDKFPCFVFEMWQWKDKQWRQIG